MICPLCSSQAVFFTSDKKREYFHCAICDLIFVPKKFHLTPAEEKQEYDLHENDPADFKYREFLNQAIVPMEGYLKQGMKGLDFGSGPGPTLSKMLVEKDYEMEIYDPFYANNPQLLERRYDFVTCTEVAEHFCDPKHSWTVLSSLLKKGGLLSVMTLFWNASIGEKFSNWWYKNSGTHVAFYSFHTLRWLEHAFTLHLIEFNERTALFRKL